MGSGCSNSSNPQKISGPAGGEKVRPATFVAGSVGFASFTNAEVIEAAMTYPAAKEAAVEAPISLTADDGTGLALESLDAQAVIEGPLAFTELRMRFRNPQSRVLEGRFQITLPEGATVSRLAMRMADGWREAEVVERMAARRAYEDFLHRKQDPMLLEKEAGNQFRARIFPIPAKGVKEVIVSFSHELRAEAGYTLPLRGLPAIADLNVKALVAEAEGKATRYEPHEMNARGTVPTQDFHVATGSGLRALRHGSNVVTRVRPAFAVDASRPTGITILFDTSASRAPGFARQVRRLGSMVEAISRAQGERLHIRVFFNDTATTEIYTGTAGDFGQEELNSILARRPLGASNLSGAIAWAGQHAGSDRLLIVGDAVATAGEEDVTAQAKLLPKSFERIDVLLVGGIRDRDAAERLVRGTRADDGVVLREDWSDEEIARRLGDATASVKVQVAGASWVWPQTAEGLQPGDELVVYAGFLKAAPKTIDVQLAGSEKIAAMPAATVPGPLLERSAIAARVARLQGDYIEAVGKDEKKALRAKIVDISTKHRVLSEHTALLVLESESDYARFGIDRTALADILSIGQGGLTLEHRAGAVMIAKNEPNTLNELNKDQFSGKLEKKKGKREDDSKQDFGADLNQMDPSKEMEKSVEFKPSEDPSDMPSPEAAGPGNLAPPPPPRPRPMVARPPRAEPVAVDSIASEDSDDEMDGDEGGEVEEEPPSPDMDGRQQVVNVDKPAGPAALTGQMAEIHADVLAGKHSQAVAKALRWRSEESGNVMALVALGEALEAAGKLHLAARAYGSVIDLFPSRADLRRFAAARLVGLAEAGKALSVDSLQRAAAQRPDHLSVHRLLAYALVRAGDLPAAFAAIETGLAQQYPSGRFNGGLRILKEDLGIIAAAWLAKDPSAKKSIKERLRKAGVKIAGKASTRFVLNWETDANDVDFHIYDGKGGHAYYSDKQLPSGGELFEDVTTGYGPECFAIDGKATQYPYKLQIHYYSRGPMGYGMGQVEVMQHDGKGGLSFDQRPFVVMNDQAFVDLGTIDGPLL
jgi:hypothetical protein